MVRKQPRIRIDDQGRLEVVDPGFDSLDLLQAINPDFQVRKSKLAGFAGPLFIKTRRVGCGLKKVQLSSHDLDVLWGIHNDLGRGLSTAMSETRLKVDEASMLDLKVEIAWRLLQSCCLCSHRCDVNRVQGETGVCRLGTEAIVAEHFIHIAEEPPVNPSLVLSLAGCGLRCCFCQQADLLNPGAIKGERLDKSLWSKLITNRARSLSFVGGNPDESLYAILRFLSGAPSRWKLPIVWNSHAYASSETVSLLNGIVDVFIPDFKYSDESCGKRLSVVANYPATAKANITSMLAQNVPVIVRILVLPGHVDCCHVPALEYLASIADENLAVSVRDQYCPDWKINVHDGKLTRRTSLEEWRNVFAYAQHLGLRLISP